MHPGPLVRRLFGPYEHWVAEVYRKLFVDLDDLAKTMSAWVPQANRILEVGCGEGAMTERLVRIYPSATITAIDISPKAGRLFRGDASRVTFCRELVEDIARTQPGGFDLVVLSDVLHHVPPGSRSSLLSAVNQCMAPDGALIFKDWLISRTPIHWLCYGTDRYLTGDRIAYFKSDSLKTFITGAFGSGAIQRQSTVRPWSNNVMYLIRRA